MEEITEDYIVDMLLQEQYPPAGTTWRDSNTATSLLMRFNALTKIIKELDIPLKGISLTSCFKDYDGNVVINLKTDDYYSIHEILNAFVFKTKMKALLAGIGNHETIT